jgi:glycosidase
VCYEVFVRSFQDRNGDGIGDLNGLIEKLDYINDGDPNAQKDLGAPCIWLMPVAEAESYHGYDVVDYYRIEQDYGANDDFKRLIQEAHKRGIKVIVDLVLNHTSREHPWFKDALNNPNSPYRDWYMWSTTDPGYPGPWGDVAWHRSPARDEYYYGVFWEGMPDLNYRNPQVTAEAHKISAFWLNEMGVDGFRLDAIKHLIENGRAQEGTPETHAWLRDYRKFLEQTKPGTFTIGEIFGADSTALEPYYPDQLDEYFQFQVGEKLVAAANFGQAMPFLTAAQNAYDKLPFQRWAPFLTNHDQNRVMSTLGNDVSKAKIAATALLTLPGMPFVYYGEEIGMQGTKPDERIRTPMQWTGDDTTGGFTTGRPWESLQQNYKEVNVAAQDGTRDSLLNLYRRLVHLHTQHPALGQGSFTPLKASASSVAAFVRQTDDEAILVVFNFGKAEVSGATLSLDKSALATGSYKMEPLLSDQAGTQLTVGEGGSVTNYAPLSTLAPRTGYIFKLTR